MHHTFAAQYRACSRRSQETGASDCGVGSGGGARSRRCLLPSAPAPSRPKASSATTTPSPSAISASGMTSTAVVVAAMSTGMCPSPFQAGERRIRSAQTASKAPVSNAIPPPTTPARSGDTAGPAKPTVTRAPASAPTGRSTRRTSVASDRPGTTRHYHRGGPAAQQSFGLRHGNKRTVEAIGEWGGAETLSNPA